MPFRRFAFLFAVLLVAACAEPDAAETPETGGAVGALFPVVQGGQWGYIDTSGTVVIAPQFEEAANFSDGRALVRQGGRYGYIDRTGAFAIEPRYEDGLYFSDGLAPVQESGTWHYIDASGARAGEADFDLDPRLVEEDRGHPRALERVQVGDRYGFRNAQGQTVVDPRYEQAWYFAEGLARVQQDGKWGYIDQRGEVVVAPRFDRAWDFDGGLALVEVGGRYGYIDRTGRYVWEPTN